MNTDLITLKKFLNTIRFRRTIQILVNETCVHLSALFFFSSFLSVLFAFFPWVILPSVWDVSIIITVLLLFWKSLNLIVIHPLRLHEIAHIIERHIGKPHQLLSIAIEFEHTDHSNSFTTETFKSAAAQAAAISPKDALPSVSAVPEITLTVSALFFVLSCIFSQPSLPAYWNLPLTIVKNNDFTVQPGSLRVPSGSSLTLRLIPSGAPLPSSRLTLFTDNHEKRSSVLLRPDSNAFSYKLNNLDRSMYYQFSYGNIVCKAESVQVVPPPMISGLRISATPPPYMHLSKLQFNDEWGDLSIPAGSDITILLLSSELSSAKLLIGSDSLAMNLHNDTASISMKLLNDVSYSFALRNSFNVPNDSLPSFHITMQPDESPFVQITRPGRNKTLNVNQVETLWVDAIDDFGIRSLYCQWYRSGSGELSEKKLSLSSQSPSCNIEYRWDLNSQSLYPGDTIYYWIKVQDTRPDRLQEASSDTFTFRLPGFEEIQQNISDNGEYVSEKISEVHDKQTDMKEKLKSLSKNSGDNKEASWEQKQVMQDIKQEFKAQADTLQKALDALQESIAKLRDENVLNDDILKKMEDIEKTLKELIAQYGDSLLNLTRDEQPFSTDDMKEAIQKTQEMLPELENRLDNTLKFLELLKKDQELAMMATQAEKLAKEQLDLKQQRNASDFKEKQKSLNERIEQFADSVSKKMNENQQVSKALDQIQKNNQQMQSAMNNGEKPDDEQMSEMGNSLMDLGSKLRQSMASEKMKQLQKLRATLLSLATDLFTLTEWNQQIVSEMKSTDDKEIALAHQALIQAMHNAQTKIDTLPSVPPQLQVLFRNQFRLLYRESNDALQATGGPDALFGLLSEEQALRQVADAVVAILEQMNSQNNSSSSSGMSGLMDQLQKLSGKQSAINSAVSQLLRSMMSGSKPGEGECKNGNGNKPGGMSESQAKARKEAENAQRALADQLDELAKKFGGDKSGEGAGMSKRMEELEKEARNLAERLRNPPTADIRDRQDRFLSRMLQATLSMHRQDEGKEERKSKSAKELFSDDKPGTTLSEAKSNPDAFYTMRRRALESNFPGNYRAAIKAYFDSLGVLYLKK
ncbi:MAG TPA: hypothetical protein VHO70_13185 [Chitinispirillaceae bacterium]|nr:hypothetical protein [Chitinispirillaceae bacterium]